MKLLKMLNQKMSKCKSQQIKQYTNMLTAKSFNINTRIEIVTSTIVKSSQSSFENSVIVETFNRNSLLSIQQRTDFIQGRRIFITKTVLKRKKFNDESSYKTIIAVFESYFFQERMKCEKLKLRFFDDHIKDKQIKNNLMKLSLNANVNIFKCFVLIIDSCESLIILKNIF